MNKGPNKTMLRRSLILLIIIVLICFGLVVFSLFRLQIIQGSDLKSKALNQQTTDTVIKPNRGTIFDANGKVLAQSAGVWKIVLEPKTLNPNSGDTEAQAANRANARAVLVSRMSDIFNMKEADIEKILAKDTYYEILQRQVESDKKEEVVALKEELAKEYNQSSGIIIEEDSKRYYPYSTMAASLIGFVGTDGEGLAGLEAYYDDVLSGTSGRVVSIKNGVGDDTPFDDKQRVDAEDGASLKLTIDTNIQSIMERYLNEGIETNNVHNGAVAICMNVKTGAILGLANANEFDLNDPYTLVNEDDKAEIKKLKKKEDKLKAESEALQKQWRNKAVTDTYYPGSVFKMATLSMALEEGKVSLTDHFTCSGAVKVVDRTIKCWTRDGHGDEDVIHGTMNSCNPMYIWLGQKLGQEGFLEYFNAFGFADKTGVDLPGEATGIVKELEDMNDVDLAVYSFGQNFSITPLQMITACSAIANGGKLMQPYVVQQVIGADGSILSTTKPTVKRQVISKETSDKVISVLKQNAEEGTASNGNVVGYRICGKTGTSEKVDKYNSEGGEAKGAEMQYIASYCGFAPADDPEIALIVIYDEPDADGNYYGGSVSGPVFQNMMKEILPYLGIEARYSSSEEAPTVAAPNVVGASLTEAKRLIEHEGLEIVVYGSGKNVISQSPTLGSQVPTGGFVAVFTDSKSEKEQQVTVPNFEGMTYSEAKDTADDYNLQIVANGAVSGGTVGSQDIARNTKVATGSVIQLNMVSTDTVQ